MKKYTQITIFAVLFFIVVIFLRLRPQDTSAPIKVNNSVSSSSSSTPQKKKTYKDGVFTGSVTNVYYGNVQVKVTIASGKISTVDVLQYPNDNPTSSYISSQAIPMLKSEVIKSQSGNINTISGASYVSEGFIQSLQNALSQAA